jgi:hydrogenase nickel incorporation protein HypB
MCATCGCGSDSEHEHEAYHHHQERARIVRLEKEILDKNAAHARDNRAWLSARRVAAINLVGAPGSGKTTLLEAALRMLAGLFPVSVIEGDQETERDAARVRAAGGRALQLNTGTGCHLDAHSVGHALKELDPPPRSLVVIENVGNLVCPALFDLGERSKVVVLSVTEGEDKPAKYPHMFRVSELLLLNKVDLQPHLRFDVERCLAHAREVNPKQRVMQLSATTGHGLDAWCAWLGEIVAAAGRP